MATTSAVAALQPDTLAAARPRCSLCRTLVMRIFGFCFSIIFTYASRSSFKSSDSKISGYTLSRYHWKGLQFSFSLSFLLSDTSPVSMP
ncbi:hypothetical protein EYF80_004725 [Liparis tanakae]|uniref:Uncharacterized protein n=1 Tax=Liparis tanakae TaxID=230148 RepID=A0A4Z2J559_9TELE|nr:hypothetical protein EYF80_004725 [Liparis tanakae]